MKGPHKHGRLTEGTDRWEIFKHCEFCGVDLRTSMWGLCPKSPEVDRVPVVGEVWEVIEPGGIVRTTITAVDNVDAYWMGHTGTSKNFYDRDGKVNWPLPGSTLIREAPGGPPTVYEAPRKLRLARGDDAS